MADIPRKVADTSSDGELPRTVAELSQEADAPELSPYLISFLKYNDRACELSLLDRNKARKAIQVLKTIGMKIRSGADFQRNSIDRIPVQYKGDYKKLFNGLAADIELKEIKLQQDARIFYFDIEPERTFYVVAITQNHLETDKNR